MTNTILIPPTDAELSAFRYLDQLKADGMQIGIRPLVIKYSYSEDDAMTILKLWNKANGNYKLIQR